MLKKGIQLLAVFFILLFFNSYSQKNTVWDYPIKPKSEEWKELKSYKAKVEVCQIPENILQNINTNDLIILCLQYPFLYNEFAFNDINDGVEKLFTDFNGIREFSKREGALNYLQEKYHLEINLFQEKINTSSNSDIGHSMLLISMLEILLCYSDFYISISKETQMKILESLLFGYKKKNKHSEYFQGRGFTTNLFSRAHIILKIKPSLSEIFAGKSVLFSGMADAELINTIDSLTYQLIK